MTELLKLYRADNKGNITLPEKYRTDGLLTKQINGGDPFFIKKYGWIKSIKSHIKSENHIEKYLHETTAFLSLTDNRDIAENIYLPTRDNYCCKKTTAEFADAYLFNFQIEENKLKQCGKGIYIYEFQCDYEKFKNPQSIVDLFIKCNICSNNNEYKHVLLIIDAVMYLNELLPDNRELETAYVYSKRDCEWLLMPLDLMPSGIGYQSRIPVANFWNVEYYKHIKN